MKYVGWVKPGPSFDAILDREPGPSRTAGIAAWFQSLYGENAEVPVLVGGAAVELYTRGAYTTGDLDFVGDVPREVEDQLSAAGFAKKGRHWVHTEGQIFIELPARAFDQETQTDTVVFDDQTIVVVSPEDLLVDRLAAWQFWKVTVEGINAFLLWGDRGPEMNAARLENLAEKAGLRTALQSLRSFAAQGQENPSMEEVERWARRVR